VTKFNPVKDNIVIEKVSQSKSIMLPQTEAVSDDVFTVTSVGPDCTRIKSGDMVCIVGYINTFSHKGIKTIIAKESDVVCVITEEESHEQN
jgi:co-chaperonin GroES (HSP10)